MPGPGMFAESEMAGQEEEIGARADDWTLGDLRE